LYLNYQQGKRISTLNKASANQQSQIIVLQEKMGTLGETSLEEFQHIYKVHDSNVDVLNEKFVELEARIDNIINYLVNQ